MKYFSPSYWFKLLLLSAPLFNDKTIGINASSIDNKKIKDWISNNTNLQSINQEISYTNSSSNYQLYNLNETNQNINLFYQTELETSTHNHFLGKKRSKRNINPNLENKNQKIEDMSLNDFLEFNNKYIEKITELKDKGNFIAVATNNNIYIGTRNGFYILKPNETVATEIQGITPNNLLIDKNDNVYLNTFRDGVYVLKNGETLLTKIAKTNEYNDWHTNPINIDNQNNIYIGTNNGILIIKEIKEEICCRLNGDIRLISIDKNDNVYFSTRGETYVLKYNENIPIKINGIMGNNFLNVIKFDKNKTYLGTYDGAYILKYNETIATKIEGIEVQWPNSVNKIEIDNKHNVYFAGEKKDIWMLKQGEKSGKKITQLPNFIKSIISDKDDIYFEADNSVYTMKINDLNSIRKLFDDGSNLIKDNQNNIYISKNKYIYGLKQINPIISNLKTLINNYYFSISINSQNNIYLLSYNDVYLFKTQNNNFQKINGISGIATDIFIDKNDNVYFGTISNGAYFLKYNENIPIKINLINDQILSINGDSKNNVYFGTWQNGAYVLKQNETIPVKINGEQSFNFIKEIFIDKNDNIYFNTANNGAYVLKYNETIPIKINNNIFNDMVNKPKINIGKNNNIISSVIDKNDNVYFVDHHNFWFLQNTLNLDSIIKSTNLKNINNNYDETILNTLNYLNRENNYFWNLNKMKIVNKTPNSATVVAIKGKYRGQITVNYKIENQHEINNIYLIDLLQKAVYFDFINKNFYSINKIKDIKDINIENLNFWNVEVTRDSELLHSVNFKNACFNKKEKINRSSITKTLKIPKCEYNTTSKISFQITKGLTKKASIKKENKPIGWNIDIEDEIKLSDFININNKESEIINTLSDKFDISNINKQTQEMILVSFNEDEDELQIAPKERVEFKYSVREINLETNLNLKQKITGTFSAKIINDENQEETIILSPKEAMQTLQKYNLLPNEFNINEDNSITFNGKTKISLIQEAKPQKIENSFSI